MSRKSGELPVSRRILTAAGGWAGWLLTHLVNVTVRYRWQSDEPLRDLRLAGKPVILCFWHNQILSASWLFRGQGIVVMTSRHLDGEYIARVIRRLGFGTARGSSTRGGVAALKELSRRVRGGEDAGFTVDGPKGPRYVAKPGPIQLARLTGAPILPFHVEVERCWEFRSWDRFRVPRPLTRGLVLFAPPFHVGDGEDPVEGLSLLQGELDRLRAMAESRFDELYEESGAVSR